MKKFKPLGYLDGWEGVDNHIRVMLSLGPDSVRLFVNDLYDKELNETVEQNLNPDQARSLARFLIKAAKTIETLNPKWRETYENDSTN